jgi:predicted AlkP superfamily phosphohydrolase/phosphomutase
MPDIVIIWDVDARVTTEVLIEKLGLIRKPSASCQLPPYYTGNHAPRAFAVAIGPDVPRGTSRTGGSILDLAPTILATFGIEAPEHMVGRLLGELSGGPVS